MVRCLMVGALLCVSLSTQAGNNRWTPLPLYGGESWAMAVSAQDPNLHFVSTNQSGLFRSTDGGSSWASATGFPESDVRALLVQAPVARGSLPERILAAGGSFVRVFRSIDGGDTWTPSTTQLPFGRVEKMDDNPANREIIYAAHGFSGIYKSLDGGDTWTQMNTGLGSTFCTDVAVDPVSTNTVLAVCDALYRSTTAGASWSQVVGTGLPSTQLTLVEISPADSNTIFAIRNNAIYRTTNGGMNWTNTAAGGLLPDLDFRAFLFDPTDPDTVYVGASAGPWRSENLGDTWVAANNGHVGNINSDLAIHPSQPNRIVASTFSGIWRSEDSGANWQRSETGFRALTARDLVFTPGNADRFFVGADSGLYRTLDGGASFEYLTSTVDGESIVELYMDSADSMHLIAGGGSSRLYESNDGGDTWTNITASSGLPFGTVLDLAAAPATPSLVYAAAGSAPEFNVSTNGGSTFTSPGAPPTDFAALAVDPLDSMAVFGSWFASVQYTDNGGMTWANRSTGLPVSFMLALDMNPSNSLELVAASAQDGIYRTTDGGMGWSAINNGIPVLLMNDVIVDFLSTTRFLAAGLDGVFVTEDSGANWANSGAALMGRDVNLVRQNTADGDLYYAGSNADTLYSFTRVPPGLTVTPQSLSVSEGASTSFNITLDADATDPVTIDLSTNNSECSVMPPQLVLNVQEDPGLVTVTGTPDQVIDGTQSCTVITGTAESDDPAYDMLEPEDVLVDVLDSDVAQIQVLAQQPVMVMEPDSSAQFVVRLSTIPIANVNISVTTDDPSEGTAGPNPLIIMPSEALGGVQVTVTAVDDASIDGDNPFTVILGPATSGDDDYLGLDPADVNAINLDDDYIIFNDSLED